MGRQRESRRAGAPGAVPDFLGLSLRGAFHFCLSFVPLENRLHLRKSIPVLMAAGVIWVLVALAYTQAGDSHSAEKAIRASLLEYAELFLFILAAMTYINSLEERNVFRPCAPF